MDSKVYKVLGVIAIIVGIIIGIALATVEVPKMDSLTAFSIEKKFVWGTFILYTFIGTIGGLILIGIGDLTEDIASVGATLTLNYRGIEKKIESKSPQSSASNQPISRTAPAMKRCQVCGKLLKSGNDTPLCRECINK